MLFGQLLIQYIVYKIDKSQISCDLSIDKNKLKVYNMFMECLCSCTTLNVKQEVDTIGIRNYKQYTRGVCAIF